MKYVLILIAILFSSQAVALNCEKQPTCEELNYSKEDDPQCAEDGYILCPFDFSYKKCLQPDCEKLGFTQSDKSLWCNEIASCPFNASYTLCNRKAVQCKVGDVYYADDTCGSSNNLDTTKIPVGVVFYVTADGRHGRVLAFDEFQGAYSAMNSISAALPLFTCEQVLDGLKKGNPDLYDGQAQTQKVAALDSQSAAAKALEYYPQEIDPDTPYTGKGNWYLPTLGEWEWLYDHEFIDKCPISSGGNNYANIPIVPVLKKLGKSGMRTDRFWSINLFSSKQALYFGTTYGDIDSKLLLYQYYIRPIMKF